MYVSKGKCEASLSNLLLHETVGTAGSKIGRKWGEAGAQSILLVPVGAGQAQQCQFNILAVPHGERHHSTSGWTLDIAGHFCGVRLHLHPGVFSTGKVV